MSKSNKGHKECDLNADLSMIDEHIEPGHLRKYHEFKEESGKIKSIMPFIDISDRIFYESSQITSNRILNKD